MEVRTTPQEENTWLSKMRRKVNPLVVLWSLSETIHRPTTHKYKWNGRGGQLKSPLMEIGSEP